MQNRSRYGALEGVSDFDMEHQELFSFLIMSRFKYKFGNLFNETNKKSESFI